MKLIFLGDSITEGVGATCEENKYVSVVAKICGVETANFGVSGTRIARQKKPTLPRTFDYDFQMRAEVMDKDADMVFVFGGTNDFGHGDAPIGTMSDRTPYTFYGALHCLYTALIEKYPGVPIVVLTPLHRITEDIPTGDNKPAPVGTLKEYVNIIREVAEYYSLPVLDLFKESGLQPKIPVIQQKYVPDGLHPNDAGNEILAHKIARFLEML